MTPTETDLQLADKFLQTTKTLRRAGKEVPAIAAEMGLGVDDFMAVYTLAEQAVLDSSAATWNVKPELMFDLPH